ncbi:MAG: TIGR03905 family TSCPD domain-containing protein [Treponema sp.]|nr:TIGR03905 family TSCPD domain-containing protein [Treponema sp.]
MPHKYKARGTCAREISFELREGKVHDVSFTWGCNGNLKALGILAEGMDATELVRKLIGLTCGVRKTSCGDQLAKAVAKALADAAIGAAEADK